MLSRTSLPIRCLSRIRGGEHCQNNVGGSLALRIPSPCATPNCGSSDHTYSPVSLSSETPPVLACVSATYLPCTLLHRSLSKNNSPQERLGEERYLATILEYDTFAFCRRRKEMSVLKGTNCGRLPKTWCAPCLEGATQRAYYAHQVLTTVFPIYARSTVA